MNTAKNGKGDAPRNISEQFRKNLEVIVTPRNPASWQTGRRIRKRYGQASSQSAAGPSVQLGA